MPTCQPLALQTCTASPCCWSPSAPKDQSSLGRRTREGWPLLWTMERGHLGTFLAPRALPLGQPCLQGSGGLPAAVPEGVLTFYPGEEGDGVQSRQAARLESVFICIYCGQPLAPAGPSNIRDWTSWIHPVPSDPHSIPVPGVGGLAPGRLPGAVPPPVHRVVPVTREP